MALFSGFGVSEEDLEWSIQQLLARQGYEDVSRAACKLWARKFIQERVPGWMPGTPLLPVSRAKVGAAFMEVLRDHRLLQNDD